ncbi:late competence protein ComER [Paenibacillus protaetiae]|uniref:Pyrroline-5-carboxylate reductase n=1 Tax=Paenibacillus protaetiae TaxID=2509456 RepID=A0A4P6EXB2_9BACL|nr:late competence protein ComER [Paenibacillus protaetiae]QAY66379.1 late competence protein ComER [Paenibacillus protaetiae]
MNVGFIGTGTMGSLLIEALISSDALAPEQIKVSNRTPSKAEALARRFPGLKAVLTNTEAAKGCEIVFLCVKPLEFHKVVAEIASSVQPEQLLISITSPVLIEHLEQKLPCKIAKVIPSITNYVWSGATLCIYGTRVTDQDRDTLEQLLGRISAPLRIEEAYTRIVSDISSCGPAFFAHLLEQFIEAAVEQTGIEREEATRIASEMLLGTGLLLTEGGMTPAQVQDRVSVPGGITAQALDILRQELPGVFTRLVHTTHDKFREDVEKVEDLFNEKEVNGP